jgi:hypothetical protein
MTSRFAVEFSERLDSSKRPRVDLDVLEVAECVPALH